MNIVKTSIIIASFFCLPELAAEEMNLIDPTRPVNFIDSNVDKDKASSNESEGSSAEDLRLHAIKISGSSRLAVINGQLIRAGESMGVAKLLKINTGSVDMDVDGELVTITLLPKSIKIRSGQ